MSQSFEKSPEGETGITAAPPLPTPSSPATSTPRRAEKALWRTLLAPIASLRLTVVLFVLAAILVIYGTLVQVDLPNFTAIRVYFRSLVVLIPARTLLFNASPTTVQDLGLENFRLPYPGGWLIGGVMFANLLAAHALHFKLTWRRSGILMIHGGLVLMMLSEFFAGLYAIEGQMPIPTGTSANYIQHTHLPEIAFVRPAAEKGKDEVAVVPTRFLFKGSKIEDPKLPCDLTVLEYFPNSNVIEVVDPEWPNPATIGTGVELRAVQRPEISGTETMQSVDMPSAYVKLTDRASGKDLGVMMLSSNVSRAQPLKIGDQNYDVSLRFKRSYRDYNLKLNKFVFDKYIGTETPKDYRSFVTFTDAPKKVDRDIEIYMNHPFRYEGETFFQSGVLPDSSGTVLQVVRNPGWTLPYLSCLIVGVGMLVHFGLTLSRFVEARSRS